MYLIAKFYEIMFSILVSFFENKKYVKFLKFVR